MARIRTIKPDFWSNEKVMSCSRNSRLLFIGLWNYADDAGRMVDSAKTVKAQIFPGDDDVCSAMVRGMLDELSTIGLLQKYEHEGRAYLQITGWDHQKIDRPRASKIPSPNSSNERRPLATDLTLSNLTLSNLTKSAGQNNQPRSLANASEADGSMKPEKEAWRSKRPSDVRGPELHAAILARKQ